MNLFRQSRSILAAVLTVVSFVAEAADKPAADKQSLPSGVTLMHSVRGKGTAPAATDVVTVHYRGTLAGGQEFDSSYKRKAPASFPLNRVIPCWTQALQQMAPGGKATITCPAATAYGASELPGIPANSQLTFEVELLSVGKP